MRYWSLLILYKNRLLDNIIYNLRLGWLLTRKFFRRLYASVMRTFLKFQKTENSKSYWFSKYFSWYVNLYKKWIQWVSKSTLNFAIFFFGSSTIFALVRFAQMWFLGVWELLPFFYGTVAFSYFISFCAVYGKYQSNVSPRVLSNRVKWDKYVEKVITENKLNRSRFFAHPFWSLPIILPITVSEVINGLASTKSLALTKFGLFFGLFALLYSINLVYYTWKFRKLIIKPPIPQAYRLEPPDFYVKMFDYPIVNKLFFTRNYATKTRFEKARLLYENNKKSILGWTATGFAVLTLVNTVSGLDAKQADTRRTTPLHHRVYDVAGTGYWSPDVRTRHRAAILNRWGVDLSDLRYEGTIGLDPTKVNEAYEKAHIEHYPNSRFAAERKLAAVKAELSETKAELSETKNRLDELERRFASLDSKDSDKESSVV